ncbi:MAG: hypothetical protein WKF73_14470 [Nocardioidaceae bacterium]
MTSTSDHGLPSRSLLIRADSGAHRGAGHVMRCLAVAEAATELGWRVHLSADLSALSWVQPWIESLGVETVQPLDTVTALWGLAKEIHADAILLDHYDFPNTLSAADAGNVLMANFEDGEFGRRSAHLSIDYALGAETRRRPDDGSMRCLRGIRYAPIRSEIRAGRLSRPEVGWEPVREQPDVVVVMGGTDAHDLAAMIGAMVADVGGHVLPVETGLSRLSQLQQADAVISAAGVSAYELAHLGIPAALLQIADNQAANYAAMVAAGAVTGLGTTTELHDIRALVAERMRDWLSDPAGMAATARTGQRLVDGDGAARIITALAATRQSMRRR